MDEQRHSRLLIDSLLSSDLLVDEMAGYVAFERSLLSVAGDYPRLNFKQKLGHLYEDALEWLINASAEVELLQRGLQMFRPLPSGGRETLGELDFVVRVGEQVYHIELATKFYLQVDGPDGEFWPGPDARDHWQRKRRRMVDHQLGMGKHEQARALLLERYGVKSYTTTHLIYGCLFHRFSGQSSRVEGIAKGVSWGSWITPDQWHQAFSDQTVWFMPKHLWPCQPGEWVGACLDEVSKAEALAMAEHRCVMFTDRQRRYFLVSQRWLDEVGLA